MLIDTKQLGMIKPCLYYTQLYDKSFFMNIHRHEPLEIMYVSSGSMHLTTLSDSKEEVILPVFQGQFALIKSNIPHKISIPDSSVILNVEFETFGNSGNIDELFFGNAITSVYATPRDYCLKSKEILIFEDSHNVLQSLTRLQEWLSSDISESVFELSYALLLAQLLSDILNCETVLRMKKRGNVFVKRAMEYMNSNLHKNISLEELCRHANCSKAYLEKSFKAEFNCTVRKKMNEQRVARAKNLLKNFSVSSTDIGKTVGFENQQSFINNFRLFTGSTPLEYRKRQRIEYKTLHAYEKSYFDKKFDRFFSYSIGAFIHGCEWEQGFLNPHVNTLLYSGNLHKLFNSEKKKLLESRKYLLIDTASLFSDNFDLLSFNDCIIQNGLFDCFIGFYINFQCENNGKELTAFIDFVHKFFPFKRILLDCEQYGVLSPEDIESSHVTDVILPNDSTILQKFISAKINIWLKRKIRSCREIKETTTFPIGNFGGVVYSFIDEN